MTYNCKIKMGIEKHKKPPVDYTLREKKKPWEKKKNTSTSDSPWVQNGPHNRHHFTAVTSLLFRKAKVRCNSVQSNITQDTDVISFLLGNIFADVTEYKMLISY